MPSSPSFFREKRLIADNQLPSMPVNNARLEEQKNLAPAVLSSLGAAQVQEKQPNSAFLANDSASGGVQNALKATNQRLTGFQGLLNRFFNFFTRSGFDLARVQQLPPVQRGLLQAAGKIANRQINQRRLPANIPTKNSSFVGPPLDTTRVPAQLQSEQVAAPSPTDIRRLQDMRKGLQEDTDRDRSNNVWKIGGVVFSAKIGSPMIKKASSNGSSSVDFNSAQSHFEAGTGEPFFLRAVQEATVQEGNPEFFRILFAQVDEGFKPYDQVLGGESGFEYRRNARTKSVERHRIGDQSNSVQTLSLSNPRWSGSILA